MSGLQNRIRLYAEFKKIDQHLRDNDCHEKFASQSLFDAAGWSTNVGSLLEPKLSYLIYANHRHFLDSSAANLMLPESCRCKRIVNSQAAESFGELYAAKNFVTLSRFHWKWLFRNCYDWTSRFFYLASSGWFHSVPTDKQAIANWLREGNSLITFPTGVFGSARWRRGLGQLIRDYLDNPETYQRPLMLVGLNVDFCFSTKQVNVNVVNLESAESLRRVIEKLSDVPIDIQLTEYLENQHAAAVRD